MMKKSIVLLIIFSVFIFNNLSAKTYDDEIKALQEQINQLNDKIEKNNKEINKKYNKTLNNLSINGRIHVIGAWYNDSDELKETNNTSDYKDKFAIKRARFTVSKEINDFLFQFEGNFNNNRVRLGETFVGYKINDNMILKVGQILTPSFIEKEKSSNTMATIDASAFDEVDWLTSYLIGLNYVWNNDSFGLSTGIFGNGVNNENNMEKDISYDTLLRAFYTPIRNNDYTIHLGFDLVYQNYRNDLSMNPDQLLNSYYYGLEFGLKYKILTLTSEYLKMYYEYDKTRFDGSKFNFDALATELTINFTGERTSYEKSGYFSLKTVNHPLSKGGYGAFQGVIRQSFANGKDKSNGFLNNIGSLYDYTIGLTWLPENGVRILINYSKNYVVGKDYSYKGKYDAFKIEARMYF